MKEGFSPQQANIYTHPEAPTGKLFHPVPPPPFKNNTLVRATVGVFPQLFGTVEFGGLFWWVYMRTNFCCDLGPGMVF